MALLLEPKVLLLKEEKVQLHKLLAVEEFLARLFVYVWVIRYGMIFDLLDIQKKMYFHLVK